MVGGARRGNRLCFDSLVNDGRVKREDGQGAHRGFMDGVGGWKGKTRLVL